jgi:hypothetical protein
VIAKLLAVDPGLNAGWALFRLGKLVDCGLYRGKHLAETVEAIQAASVFDLEELVVERPQAYNALRSKADPNDLITLALVAGAAMGAHGWHRLRTPSPAEWKGQTPKEIHQPRILAALEPAELAVLERVKAPASLQHNVRDAVGLGLWAHGRRTA